MIHTLIAFALVLFGWSGLLWFGIKPDFLKLSTPLLVLLHLLPPLLVAIPVWRRQRKEKTRAADEAKAKEEAERQQREAAAAAALAQHQQDMAWRRQGCDCRALAVTGLLEQQAGAAPELDAVHWQTLSEEDELLQQRPLDPLSALLPHLQQAIGALYQQSLAATHFPIYLLPPANLPGEQLISQVRAIAQAAAAELCDDLNPPAVTYLPSADHTAQRLIGLFEQQPELPGRIVLGFDSPLAQQEPHDPDEEPPAAQAEQQRQHGQAGQAVVALLLTHPDLNQRLAELEQHQHDPGADPLLPHWERTELNQAAQRQLISIPLQQRADLAALPVLARLHRGAAQYFTGAAPKTMELTKQLRTLLESALINATALPHPFEQTEAADPEPPQCGWLVHNAGGLDNAGGRLSAVSTALHAFEVDLNPIEDASNTCVRFGDVGAARPLLMAALTVLHAAHTQSAAVCAEFSAQEVAVYLAQPPQAA